AEDFDGDGRRDIWSSAPDIFASIANFLKGHGWTPDQSWGHEVHVTMEGSAKITAEVARRTGSCQATRNMTVALTPEEWTKLGVQNGGRGALPASTGEAALVSG